MQSSILFLASAMTFMSHDTAGLISPREEASLAHFELYGDDNCTTAEILGEFNLYSEDTDKCHTFPTDKAVKSVYISYINNNNAGSSVGRSSQHNYCCLYGKLIEKYKLQGFF
ncbi:unnamed protein product [Fusarium fujikuroi]|uniref:Uncharacterized protein n=1 Tax=Fusarium fujikuroi TaxID=5127 RepID=A0A9Q9RSW4_FUSFU|nr:unnamed protein product [Fusarium fujikuroi]VTT82102.1 unnamed protein product [Fusarium fujikuroi]VZI19234.1 unnamed protein product [Fusarium fujikuroi]